MTDDLLDRLRAATEGVTEGPWRSDGPPWNKIIWQGEDIRIAFMAHSNGLNDELDEANARFIAAARTLIPEAHDRIAALEAEVARLREALTWYKPRLKRCNAFAPDGDRARDDLAKDGGKIARAALGDAT